MVGDPYQTRRAEGNEKGKPSRAQSLSELAAALLRCVPVCPTCHGRLDALRHEGPRVAQPGRKLGRAKRVARKKAAGLPFAVVVKSVDVPPYGEFSWLQREGPRRCKCKGPRRCKCK